MYSKEELKNIGVNPENMRWETGEMNVIVQSNNIDEEDGHYYIYPDIYHPRKNSVWSCGVKGEPYFDLNDEKQREKYITHLRDSVERLKILAHKLSLQADELEKTGRIETFVYYPE